MTFRIAKNIKSHLKFFEILNMDKFLIISAMLYAEDAELTKENEVIIGVVRITGSLI